MKILKNIFICLFRLSYILIILIALSAMVLSRPELIAGRLEHLINTRLPQGMNINGLSFSTIELSLSSFCVKDVAFSFKQGGKEYAVSTQNIFLLNGSCLVAPAPCRVLVENVHVVGRDLEIKGIQGHVLVLFRSHEKRANGFVLIDTIRYNEYRISSLSTDVSMEDNNLFFNRVSAKAYEGRVRAVGRYDLTTAMITMDVDFSGIRTHQMDTVAQKWRGALDGTGSYFGTLHAIGDLTLEFRSASSDMEKTLLKFLMGDVGNTLAFLPFAKIMESADFIHLENFQGKVHNLGQDSVTVSLNIDSKQLNLKLNPDITINLR